MSTEYCVRALVSGRVQGVFFRQSTSEQARSLGVRGRAVNRNDGRVEVTAAGEQVQVQALLKWLRTGPRMARVDAVEWKECELPPNLGSGFTIG